MTDIFIKGLKMYCSYGFLERYISKKTIEDWKQRGICNRVKLNNTVYLEYDSIPAPTRAKLPAYVDLIKQAQDTESRLAIDEFKTRFKQNILNNYSIHRQYLAKKHPKIPGTYLNEAAQKWCAWEVILDDENPLYRGSNDHARFAYSEMFHPNKDGQKEGKPRTYGRVVFCRMKMEMLRDGIEAHIIDKRLEGAGKNGRPKKFSEEMWSRIMYYMAQGRKFTAKEALRLMEREGCWGELPGRRMVNLMMKKWKKNFEFYASRYGVSAAKTRLPYQPLLAPEYTNVQWQIDGWTLPFWVNGEKPFETWTLVRVIDVCSKKILARTVARSENAVAILDTLKQAVRATGRIPNELVMDKHAGTKTDAFANFESRAIQLGTLVVISKNPTDKADIERHNQYLNSFAKEYPEWLGEGMSGKNPRRRTEEELQELRKTKNQLSTQEVVARGLIICEHFNNDKLRILNNLTPAEQYEVKESRGVAVTEDQVMSLFHPPVVKRVIRGQVIMQQGIQKAVYTLSAEHIEKYNDTEVMVHSDGFGDDVYLFDQEGYYIQSASCDQGIGKSITNRTADDVPKSKGKASVAKRRSEKDMAMVSNPASAAFMPSHLIHKDAYSEIRQSAELQRMARIEGLNPEKTHRPTVYVPGEKQPVAYAPEINDDEAADLVTINTLTNKKSGK